MKFSAIMPNGQTMGSILIEQLLQNDEVNLQVVLDSPIVGGSARGLCVYWDDLNERWLAADGLNPPKNTLIGILEDVDGMSGQVRVGGIFQEPSILGNKVYYIATNGALTTVPSKVVIGRSTNSGRLVLTINGGGMRGSGGGSVGDFSWRNYVKESEVKANGALLSRIEYSDLWEFANDMSLVKTEAQWSGGLYGFYSVGNGTSTFRVPDLRGVVVRGLDDGRGLDSGRVLGSYQADIFGSHSHSFSAVSNATTVPVRVVAGGNSGTTSGTVGVDAAGGAETRMKNIALYACIQFE